MVSVTIDALRLVKLGLCKFEADAVGICEKIGNKADRILGDARISISKAQNDVRESEQRVQGLNGEIKQCYHEIARINDGICRAQNEIQSFKGRMASLEAERDRFEAEYRRAEAGMYRAENDLSRLRSELTRKQGERDRLQSELTREKSRLEQCKGKLGRLQVAYRHLEDDMNAYVNAARAFRASSGDTAARDITAINRCIRSIEKYISEQL